jgi:hypothetical protein
LSLRRTSCYNLVAGLPAHAAAPGELVRRPQYKAFDEEKVSAWNRAN